MPSGVPRALRDYWTLYGGFRALYSSVYLRLSIVGTVLIAPLWLDEESNWPQQVYDIALSLLGFSLGALTIILGLGAFKVFKRLANEGSAESLFMRLVANFVHFIIVQSAAIFAELISEALGFVLFSAACAFLLVYFLASGIALIGQILNVAKILNASAGVDD